MTSLVRSYACIAVLSTICAFRAAAQGTSPTTIKSCVEAVRFVQHGTPAHKQTAAIDYLARCGGSAATVLADAVARSRSEQDVATLDAFYASLQTWRDSSVMEAAIQVARDPNASMPSRVFAIGHLLWLANPGYQYSYQKLIEGTAVTHLPCVAGYASEHPSMSSVGHPLPQDYVTRLSTVLRQVLDDTSIRPEVRNAASCIDF
jgi:hypothetical protein